MGCLGSRGQIGDNSQTEKVSKPTYIPVNNTDVWGVAVGGTNTSAILTDGYVYTWGASDLGQIGNGTAGQSSDTETNELVPAKTGEDYISLDEYFVTLHEGETSVINPVYNKFFNVIQNTDSSVNFSASSINGNIASVSGLTINPVSTGKTQIIVSGGGRQTTVEVTVLMNGYKTLPQVAAGEGFTVALDKDGKVYTWGKNDLGQLGDQGKENRIVPTEITFDFLVILQIILQELKRVTVIL